MSTPASPRRPTVAPRSRATAIRSSPCCAAYLPARGHGAGDRERHRRARGLFRSRSLPHLTWQPTDIDPDALASIEAHRAAANAPNLLCAARARRDRAASGRSTHADAVVSINMIHIAPWAAAQGLMAGAARLLAPGSVLYLYGPFKENGAHTAPSNAAFDASLRAHDPAWGVRDTGDVARRSPTATVSISSSASPCRPTI